jgi:hypothetical protein
MPKTGIKKTLPSAARTSKVKFVGYYLFLFKYIEILKKIKNTPFPESLKEHVLTNAIKIRFEHIKEAAAMYYGKSLLSTKRKDGYQSLFNARLKTYRFYHELFEGIEENGGQEYPIDFSIIGDQKGKYCYYTLKAEVMSKLFDLAVTQIGQSVEGQLLALNELIGQLTKELGPTVILYKAIETSNTQGQRCFRYEEQPPQARTKFLGLKLNTLVNLHKVILANIQNAAAIELTYNEKNFKGYKPIIQKPHEIAYINADNNQNKSAQIASTIRPVMRELPSLPGIREIFPGAWPPPQNSPILWNAVSSSSFFPQVRITGPTRTYLPMVGSQENQIDSTASYENLNEQSRKRQKVTI